MAPEFLQELKDLYETSKMCRTPEQISRIQYLQDIRKSKQTHYVVYKYLIDTLTEHTNTVHEDYTNPYNFIEEYNNDPEYTRQINSNLLIPSPRTHVRTRYARLYNSLDDLRTDRSRELERRPMKRIRNEDND